MSIVRMKKLSMLAFAEDRERIMRLLAHIGVVEISETEKGEGFESCEAEDSEKLNESLAEIEEAIALSKKYTDFKTGLFSSRISMTEKELMSSELILKSLDIAGRLNSCEAKLKSAFAEKSRLASLRETLIPWKNLKIPLGASSGRFYEILFFTIPAAVPIEEIKEKVSAEAPCAELFEVSSEKELHYMFAIAHSDDMPKAYSVLKELGGAKVNFRGMKSRPSNEIAELDKKISELEVSIKQTEKACVITRNEFEFLLAAQDAVLTRLDCSLAAEKGSKTARTFYIEGWIPAREEKMLAEILDANGCAYDFSDPAEGEEPPTLTYNSRMISPFETVTNMYSPPAYTGIDPNPMMAPFFAMFFGIMLSDAGYGLLLMLVGIFALLKLRPRGGFKNFMQLAVICGATTVFWGAMFGGFFGDAIPSVYKLFTGNTYSGNLALWFNPTEDPMTMLIFSLALGGIQIVTSMAIKAYMMIRDGHLFDAICDIGFWWVAFAGAITCMFNTKVGLYVLAAGAIGIVLTHGRSKKNVIMKFFSGLLGLYDITGYFSDLLSYSRLLALSLSTAVVGTVVNTMGLLTGPIGFFIVFLIGHVFNIAINLVGSFVHSARLQYVEFFGRFYESGGRLFAPLTIRTKNTDIIKEEN